MKIQHCNLEVQKELCVQREEEMKRGEERNSKYAEVKIFLFF